MCIDADTPTADTRVVERKGSSVLNRPNHTDRWLSSGSLGKLLRMDAQSAIRLMVARSELANFRSMVGVQRRKLHISFMAVYFMVVRNATTKMNKLGERQDYGHAVGKNTLQHFDVTLK